MDQCVDSFREVTAFSTLAANSRYFQTEVDRRDCDETAFKSRNYLYSFTRMPFGLPNDPATFQRLIVVICATVRWKNTSLYPGQYSSLLRVALESQCSASERKATSV